MLTLSKLIRHSNKFTLFAFFIFVACLSIGVSAQANASPVVGFQAGRIIDDFVFTNKDSMTPQQIQAFLVAQVPVCDTYGTKTSEFGGGTRAQWAAARGYYPPFTCLRDFSENGKQASQIIYDVAQQFSINPQVLIVLLQKEQSLITDDWPIPASSQYRTATGYGCPDTAPCDSEYFGLTNQLTWSGRMFRSILNASPTWYTPYILGNNYIQYNPNASCGGSIVNIQNRSTQALYNYTPYQPNQGALNAGWGQATCGAYGNRNFYLYFTSWFGSTYSFVYEGISHTAVFDPTYYASTYPDLQAAFGSNQTTLFNHFINTGIYEGRQGNATFSINSYRTRYEDLRNAYGSNLQRYLRHYVTTGINEGRVTTGDFRGGTTVLDGINYAPAYSFEYYTRNNPDIWTAFGLNDQRALWHFVNVGIYEGRQGNATFSINSYRTRYDDLRNAYGGSLQRYLWHYVTTGINEGRAATGDIRGGTTTLNGINYAPVYNFEYYTRNNPDIWAAFGLDDQRALWHFVNVGVYEGRQGNSTFNTNAYRTRYEDLRNAYGGNLQRYLWHYVTTGINEGRITL